ncbi:HAD-IA family hydrolase [Actinoplanes sp. NPDC026619]|uniref:HAD-IA family hydrolase n=1 Tax=Actinoplanes sp. NPDC026619 TaxID=3155798 RepID=UPI0033D158EA
MAYPVTGYAAPIVVPASADPARMKPNPEPFLQAVRDLGVQPGRSVLIGDSFADIEAGRAVTPIMVAIIDKL